MVRALTLKRHQENLLLLLVDQVYYLNIRGRLFL